MKLIFKSIDLICSQDGKLVFIGYPHTHVGIGYYKWLIKRVG